MTTYASAATIAANPNAGYTLDTGITGGNSSSGGGGSGSSGGGSGNTTQTVEGGVVVRDANGNIIRDTRAIINETTKAQTEAQLTGTPTPAQQITQQQAQSQQNIQAANQLLPTLYAQREGRAPLAPGQTYQDVLRSINTLETARRAESQYSGVSQSYGYNPQATNQYYEQKALETARVNPVLAEQYASGTVYADNVPLAVKPSYQQAYKPLTLNDIRNQATALDQAYIAQQVGLNVEVVKANWFSGENYSTKLGSYSYTALAEKGIAQAEKTGVGYVGGLGYNLKMEAPPVEPLDKYGALSTIPQTREQIITAREKEGYAFVKEYKEPTTGELMLEFEKIAPEANAPSTSFNPSQGTFSFTPDYNQGVVSLSTGTPQARIQAPYAALGQTALDFQSGLENFGIGDFKPIKGTQEFLTGTKSYLQTIDQSNPNPTRLGEWLMPVSAYSNNGQTTYRVSPLVIAAGEGIVDLGTLITKSPGIAGTFIAGTSESVALLASGNTAPIIATGYTVGQGVRETITNPRELAKVGAQTAVIGGVVKVFEPGTTTIKTVRNLGMVETEVEAGANAVIRSEVRPGIKPAGYNMEPGAETGLVKAKPTGLTPSQDAGASPSSVKIETPKIKPQGDGLITKTLQTGQVAGQVIAETEPSLFGRAVNRITSTVKSATAGKELQVEVFKPTQKPLGVYSGTYATTEYSTGIPVNVEGKTLQGITTETQVSGTIKITGQPSVPFTQTQYGKTITEPVLNPVEVRGSARLIEGSTKNAAKPGTTLPAIIERPTQPLYSSIEVPKPLSYQESYGITRIGKATTASEGTSINTIRMATPAGEATFSTGEYQTVLKGGKLSEPIPTDSVVFDRRGAPKITFAQLEQKLAGTEPVAVEQGGARAYTGQGGMYVKWEPSQLGTTIKPYVEIGGVPKPYGYLPEITNTAQGGFINLNDFSPPAFPKSDTIIYFKDMNAIKDYFNNKAGTATKTETKTDTKQEPKEGTGLQVDTKTGMVQVQKPKTDTKPKADTAQEPAIRQIDTYAGATAPQIAITKPKPVVKVAPPKTYAETYPGQLTGITSNNAQKTKDFLKQNVGQPQTTMEILGQKAATKQTTSQATKQSQAQREDTALRYKQKTAQTTDRALMPRPTAPPYTPRITIKIPPTANVGGIRQYREATNKEIAGTAPQGRRSILADLLSVEISRARYGVATSVNPKSSPGIFKYEANTLGFVPTAQMIARGVKGEKSARVNRVLIPKRKGG